MAKKRVRRTKEQIAKDNDSKLIIQAVIEKDLGKIERPEPKGLGDTVENILHATGIDKVAKFILGEDCGCDKRKEKLNKLFPYKQPLCLTESEYNWLHEFYKSNPNQITQSQKQPMLDIYNRVFRNNLKPMGCADCWRDINLRLKHVYNTYES